MPAMQTDSEPKSAGSKRALVVSYSEIHSDPRVRRQVDWLNGDDWTVDTLGLGVTKSPGVNRHFEVTKSGRWTDSSLGAAVSGRFLPKVTSFHRQLLDRVPKEAIAEVSSGNYDLFVFNGPEFLPWLSDKKALGRAATKTRFHLDLHERHRPDRRRDTLGGKITAPYYRWVYRHIGHALVHSRTVVNAPIGQMYAEEFRFEAPVPVRNIPPREDLAPIDRGDGKIKLLFHGLAARQRGFQQIIGALEQLPDNFTATFMLMPRPEVHAWLRGLIQVSPAKDRIQIVPPAPMRDIAKTINKYDLEVIYYPHDNANLEFSLPNKFFESMQGRLGLAVRDDKTMGALVKEWGNGVVVPGHSADNLAAALKDLTPEDVQRMKLASHRVADEVNAETEGRAFVEAISK